MRIYSSAIIERMCHSVTSGRNFTSEDHIFLNEDHGTDVVLVFAKTH